MKLWISLFSILVLTSCKDFDLKKQSAEEILQEEINSINWSEVDFYPTFQECGVVTSKQESKACFESEIKKAISDRLNEEQIVTADATQDTVVLNLHIAPSGQVKISSIQMTRDISSQNPELEAWLKEAIYEFPEINPASKRSVPVPLHTQLPIILK